MPNEDHSNHTHTEPMLLDIFAIRVLGVLAEKEATTPDAYPLTVNALVNGCNQLSNRFPVMQLSEERVRQTLDQLREQKLVFLLHQAGARVAKYSHNLRGIFLLEAPHLAILTMLFLRGAQTVGELRARCERLHRFASLNEASEALEHLIHLTPPLATALALAPGAKEVRYAHYLSGDTHMQQEDMRSAWGESTSIMDATSNQQSDVLEEIKNIKRELAWLVSEFERFKKQFE